MIVLLADLHLGCEIKTPNKSVKSPHQLLRETFSEIVDKILDISPDLVVISGDLFHRYKPSAEDFVAVTREFKRISETSEILYVLGNHEIPPIGIHASAKFVTYPKALEVIKGVKVVERFSKRNPVVEIGGYRILALPHPGLGIKKKRREVIDVLYKHYIENEDYDYVAMHLCINGYGEKGEEASCLYINRFPKLALAGHYHKRLYDKDANFVYPGSAIAYPQMMFMPKYGDYEPKDFAFVVVNGNEVSFERYNGIHIARFLIKDVRKDLKEILELVERLPKAIVVLEYEENVPKSDVKDLAEMLVRRNENILIRYKQIQRKEASASLEDFIGGALSEEHENIIREAIARAAPGGIIRKALAIALEVYESEVDTKKAPDIIADRIIKEVIGYEDKEDRGKEHISV